MKRRRDPREQKENSKIYIYRSDEFVLFSCTFAGLRIARV
uniref:Uncharacterized protein n=1 Tax=Anguilla anguilla TaxID=7936 RepID=A0A0E9T872_ANGAN